MLVGVVPQRLEELVALDAALDERLTVVRERQRNEPPPGEPAIDPAERDSARNGRDPRGGVRDRREAIGPSERFEPLGRVEDGRARMPKDELAPARVADRVPGLGHLGGEARDGLLRAWGRQP